MFMPMCVRVGVCVAEQVCQGFVFSRRYKNIRFFSDKVDFSYVYSKQICCMCIQKISKAWSHFFHTNEALYENKFKIHL